MAKYATLFDANDPMIAVTEAYLLDADTLVDAELRKRGIDPSGITLPNDLLTKLAINYACWMAAYKGAISEDSPLKSKAKDYKFTADLLASSISREALGLMVPSGAGFGNVTLGRS